MLRLEKTAKTKEITVTIRPRESFFSYLLCLSFISAVTIHGIGLLIFHIAPLKIGYAGSLFPPITAISDLKGNEEGRILALLEEEMIVPPYLLSPTHDRLSTLEEGDGHVFKHADELRLSKESKRKIAESERQLLSYYQASLEPVKPSAMSPIHLSGQLSDYECAFSKEEFFHLLRSAPQTKDKYLAFDVKVAGTEGKVVWIQAKESLSFSQKIWGEALLKHVHFLGLKHEDWISGTVEIFIPSSFAGAL